MLKISDVGWWRALCESVHLLSTHCPHRLYVYVCITCHGWSCRPKSSNCIKLIKLLAWDEPEDEDDKTKADCKEHLKKTRARDRL